MLLSAAPVQLVDGRAVFAILRKHLLRLHPYLEFASLQTVKKCEVRDYSKRTFTIET